MGGVHDEGRTVCLNLLVQAHMILSLPEGRLVKKECVGGRVILDLAPAELCKAWE